MKIDNFFKPTINNQLKVFAYYQIIGGVIGFYLVIKLLARTQVISGLVLLFIIFGTFLFYYSVYCGQLLLKEKWEKGIRHTTINQALQVIQFAMFGYSYQYISGVILSIGFDYTKAFEFTFDFQISNFFFRFNSEKELLTVSVNLVAIFLIYYIERLREKYEYEKKMVEESLKPNTE